jgi:hypothetical protein
MPMSAAANAKPLLSLFLKGEVRRNNSYDAESQHSKLMKAESCNALDV